MPTPSTIMRVPKTWISTKPVAKVPTMLPSVESAYTLPTRPPLCSRSCSVSLITTGEIMPRIRAGGRKIRVVMTTMRRISDERAIDRQRAAERIGGIEELGRRDRRGDIDQRQDGQARQPTRGQQDAERATLGPAVGDASAQVIADRDARQDDADDAGPRVQRHADVRRQDAPGDQLQNERAGARDEDDEIADAAVQALPGLASEAARRSAQG